MLSWLSIATAVAQSFPVPPPKVFAHCSLPSEPYFAKTPLWYAAGAVMDAPPIATVPQNSPTTITFPARSVLMHLACAPLSGEELRSHWSCPPETLLTVTELGTESIKLPATSYARQWKLWVPLGSVVVLQETLQGAAVAVPRKVELSQ